MENSMTKLVQGRSREAVELVFKFLERMFLSGGVIAVAGILAHTPALVQNHSFWLTSIYVTFGAGFITGVAASLIFFVDSFALIKKEYNFWIMMLLWLPLYGTVFTMIVLTAKFSDLQARKDVVEARSLIRSMSPECTSVVDCSR